MAEYLAPGVYVVEVDWKAKPIEGVSTSTSGFVTEELARDLVHTIRAHDPNWTGGTAHDPGVTLVEVFAWLAEAIGYRTGEEPRAAAERVSAIAAISLAQLRTSLCAKGALRTVNFFSGKRLHAEDFTAEQDATRELKRYIKAINGYGIVEGLEVGIDQRISDEEVQIVVNPGSAIMPTGDLVELSEVASASAPDAGESLYVTLCAVVARCGSERAGVTIVPDVDAAALPLARLIRVDGAWAIDTSYVPARIRR